jgi:aspartate-semialdehyde dehydrogenase
MSGAGNGRAAIGAASAGVAGSDGGPAGTLPRIALVGASTLIGEALIEELRARKFLFAELHALEDGRVAGAPVGDEEQKFPVGDVAAFDFSSVDIAFFCGRAALSERYAAAAAAHAWVIDGSSAFRAREDVPLVIADVNPQALQKVGGHGLICLPGSASVALATALAPLHALTPLTRVEVATYHAVSGSGRGAMEELAGETVALLSSRKPKGRAFGKQIAFNVIPHVDTLDEQGVAREERRLWDETRRVLDCPSLPINATSVRVPVFFGHSLAVHAAFAGPIELGAALAALKAGKGLSVIDPESSTEFPTPATMATAPDKVYVGRLRADLTRPEGLNFWVVADNIRKCAAHNAVSVAQILVNRAV